MATAKITLSASRDIPFNKLVLSQSNVRRVKAGVSIEELAEDIARRSLLRSLNVRPVLDADGQVTGMFEVPASLQPQDGLELRRVRAMGEFRVELSGVTDGKVERLKAMGLISEIISWKLRLLVPTGAAGPAILAHLMERHPLVRVADKAAA
jgi:hypothetical protein